MKNFKLIKLLALFVVLITSINTMWAGGTWYSTNMWQVWGWKTGYANDGWVKTGLGSGDDFNIGVITASSDDYTFKGLGVNTGGSGVKWVGAQIWYPDGTNGWKDIGKYNDGTPSDYYWENKSIWNYSIDKNANPGDYCISIHFYMNDGGDNYNENERKINWTIPGFKTDNPTSFSFGSNSPLNLESVAKIGIRHYGTQPSLGGCVLSGTHASQFEVIDVDYSGVTVVFKPTSVGTKTATLTITDTYSKVWTVTLTGTGAANTATTRLYFNNYNFNSNWITDGALPRFTCEYTTGIYTRYPMTKCENSTYNWYADVEIKGATVNVDRYKPSSPYNTWNTVSMSGLNASNPYAVLDNYSDGTYYGFATNHPYNDVSGGNIYYDNSSSNLTNTIYFIIGHDYKMSDGGTSSLYSKSYSMTHISNTKLYYKSLSDTWHDADYYAVVGASSDPSYGEWGSSSLSTKGASGGYTGIYRSVLDLADESTYLASATSKTGGAITITKSPTFNSTQTVNTVVKTTGTYESANSKAPISLGSLKLTSGTTTASTSASLTTSENTDNILSCKTATTTFTVDESNMASGYQFDGWYPEANSGEQIEDDAEYSYETTGAKTVYARFSAINYNVTYSAPSNGDYTIQVASGSASSATKKAIIGQTVTLAATPNDGYAFSGWTVTKEGGGTVTVTDNTFEMPADNVTITATFVVRYGLYGSLDNLDSGNEYGMPGWGVSADFTYSDGTYTCSRTLTKPNTTYKFRVLDRRTNYSYGMPSAGTYINEGVATTLGVGDGYNDATMGTAGVGSYTFTVTEDDGKPQVTITNPTSHSVTYGVVGTGGDISSVVDGEATPNAISSGGYIKDGGTLVFTHSAASTGYSFAGWYSDSSCETAYVDNDDDIEIDDEEGTLTLSSIEGTVTVYAKFEAVTYNGTLEGVEGSDGTYSVVYGATSLTVTGVAPARTGYHPYAYYLSYNESTKDYSNPIADKSETSSKELFESVSVSSTDYTNSDKQWIYTGSAPTIYVKWEKNTYTVTLDAQLGTGTSTRGTESFTATTDEAIPGGVTMPTQVGYDFDGYFTDDDTRIFGSNGAIIGSVAGYTNSNSTWAHDGNVTLYAHWTPKALTFNGTVESHETEWGNKGNWSPACVPTSGHDVTISAAVTIDDDDAVAKSVTIDEDGSITIESTGVLEVQGAITNTNPEKLVINTTSAYQGALIYDITGTKPYATVNMTTDNTGTGYYQYIASPVGNVSVNPTFAGKGVYTYTWTEGLGWDHRGYYEDFSGDEVILLTGNISGCTFAGQLNPTTGASITCTTEEGVNLDAQGVNMIPNTLTAPIKIAAMDLTDAVGGSVHIWHNGTWTAYAKNSCGEAVIPALQGYAVLTTTGGTVSFEYDDAVRGAATHNDALKAPKRTNSDILDHITVSVTTNERKVDLQLYENEQFTNNIDNGWEALYMDGDGRFGELYAHAEMPMSILAVPDLEGTVLGFIHGQAENYTISFEGDGRGYYLNDVLTEESTLIDGENTYIFSQSDNDAARFIISRMPISKTPTSVDVINDGTKARKQMINGILYIIRDGRIYDAAGVLVK